MFSNEFITNTLALSIVDGEGNDDRRTARLLATLTRAIYDALRLSGKHVPQELYRDEEAFMPTTTKTRTTPQPKRWSSVAESLGFK